VELLPGSLLPAPLYKIVYTEAFVAASANMRARVETQLNDERIFIPCR